MDKRGAPLSIVVTGANRHDVTQLAKVLQAKVAHSIMEEEPEKLCADAGYTGDASVKTIRAAGYDPHIRSHGEGKIEKSKNFNFKAGLWIVEVCRSRFNRFRTLFIHYEKLDATYF